MKRHGNLFEFICSMDNLRMADNKARAHKENQRGIKEWDKNREGNLAALHEELINKTYCTSPYKTFSIYEPKERTISMLPYKDRVAQHGIMNHLEGILVPVFTADTYSCVKGKGVHKASAALKRALKDKPGTMYCLKLDVRKFYPSIDHEVLKQQIRRKLKDNDLLALLDGIIDSAPGVPIGNYLSQHFANLYMSYFDHWLKEAKKVKHYFRYSDDMVILAPDKETLHVLLHDIRIYLQTHLRLELKSTYQIFPVEARGIDFVGYVHYHTHTRVRKRIKKTCARKMKRHYNPATAASYKGWFLHADCKHLTKKLFSEKI